MRFDIPRRSDLIDEVAAQLRGAIRDLDQRITEAVAEVTFHDDMVRKFERERPRPGRILGGKAPEWEQQRDFDEALRKQATAHGKVARLKTSHREIEPRVADAMRLRAAVEEFAKANEMTGPPVILRCARPVKLASDPHAQITGLRQQIEATIAELETCKRAPLPLEESLEVFERSLERTAFGLHDDAGGFCAADGQTRALSLGEMTWGERGPGAVDFTPALAALFGDKLREFYAQRITEFLAANPPGLPREQRKAKVAAVEAHLLDLEKVEEAVLRLAEKRGIAGMTRRASARPEIVLSWDAADVEGAAEEVAE